MTTATIIEGTKVVIVDAEGQEHEVEALSGIESAGHNFPVVWVARPLTGGGKRSKTVGLPSGSLRVVISPTGL